MSQTHVRMRYDGPAVANHRMDVAELAPALMGLGDLCRLANHHINGERAAIKVLIHADAEHKCFEIGFDLVQSIWSHAQDLVGNGHVATAKEILEWLGIIGSGGVATLGLFKFIAHLKGKPISATTATVVEGDNVLQIKVEGDDNTLIVHPVTYQLAQQAAVLANVKRIVRPLEQDGFDVLEFEGRQAGPERINKSDAANILNAQSPGEQPVDDPQKIAAWIKVYSPVFDKDATRWRFKYGDSHPYMDITATDIAQKALERGGAFVNDTYKVMLEVQQVRDKDGDFKNRYRILEVLEFYPAAPAQQSDWVGEQADDEE